MQQKKLKYILLLAVLAIWGGIIQKVASSVSQNDLLPTYIQKPIKINQDTTKFEAYSLLADYEDPFGVLDESSRESSADSLIRVTNEFLKNSALPNKTTKPDISFIQYKGLIVNPKTKKQIAIISVKGKDIFLKSKDKIDNIILNSIKKDKIKVAIDGEEYWIKKI